MNMSALRTSDQEVIIKAIESIDGVATIESCFVGILTYKAPPAGLLIEESNEVGLERRADYHFYLLYPKKLFGQKYYIEDCGRIIDGDLFGKVGHIYLGEPYLPMSASNVPVHHCAYRKKDITAQVLNNLPDAKLIEVLCGQKVDHAVLQPKKGN